MVLDLAAPPEGLAARALGAADLAACTDLAVEAGWNQTERDWALMLEIGAGVGLHDAQRGGRLVASAIALPYDAATRQSRPIGFISMVLVTPAWRRRGLATWLAERCVRALERLGCLPTLDATPAGEEVYRKLGFAGGVRLDRWRAERHAPGGAIERVPLPTDIELDKASDIAPLVALDARAFGAARRRVLEGLQARRADLAWVARRAGAPVGFVLGRDGRTATHIGPVVADDAVIAAALLAQALHHVEGAAIVDLLRGRAALAGMLADAGFACVRAFTRMDRGRADRDDAARAATLFAVAGPELG
jgi:GNAT superfamily N-acetyltransferase